MKLKNYMWFSVSEQINVRLLEELNVSNCVKMVLEPSEKMLKHMFEAYGVL